jgi:hypothetical protein
MHAASVADSSGRVITLRRVTWADDQHHDRRSGPGFRKRHGGKEAPNCGRLAMDDALTACGRPQIHQLLRLTGLDRRIPLAWSLDEALQNRAATS